LQCVFSRTPKEQVSQEVTTINQDITPIFIDLTSDDSSDILRFFIKKMVEKSRTEESFRKGFEVYLKKIILN
jgi:hypothetical protein